MPDDVVVFRPHRLRIVVVVASVALIAITALGWFALPTHIRVLFTLSQRLTLLAVLAVLIGVIGSVAASMVRLDATGLSFRNGMRTHRVPWTRVHKILLRPGDAWAWLLIKPEGADFAVEIDAEKRMVLAIQAHDGPRAAAAVAEIRRRIS